MELVISQCFASFERVVFGNDPSDPMEMHVAMSYVAYREEVLLMSNCLCSEDAQQ